MTSDRSGYIEKMISILERLMELPDTCKMPALDEEKFYTYQQAYGLLLSTNSLILTSDHIEMVHVLIVLNSLIIICFADCLRCS